MIIKTGDSKIDVILTEENIKKADREAAEELLKKAKEELNKKKD
mgnify:CR=1 FL=1